MKIFLDASICLDLLDTTRPTSKKSITWYVNHKDDAALTFYFSGDFITTIYYILTERKKLDAHKVVQAIDAMGTEIFPFYLTHSDFVEAKYGFESGGFDNFEDLMILHSAVRAGCEMFVTNDVVLANIQKFNELSIENIK